MNKAQKIAEIRRLISGDDDRHRAYFFEGEAPEGYRPGKDYLICFNELEPLAKTLKPFMAIGVSKKEYGDAFISIVNDECARSLVTWINTDELPEPTQPHPEPMEQLIFAQEPTPQPTELKQVPTPQPAPEAPAPIQEFRPVTYPTRSPYRRTHI